MPEDFTKNFVILNLFQNLKIFGLFHVVSESINLINQNDISNVTRHSERSEESPELSNFVCNPEFLNCHCEKISDFRNNLIKSTSNAIEPMGLLRRFVPHNDKLNNSHPEFISGSINLVKQNNISDKVSHTEYQTHVVFPKNFKILKRVQNDKIFGERCQTSSG